MVLKLLYVQENFILKFKVSCIIGIAPTRCMLGMSQYIVDETNHI